MILNDVLDKLTEEQKEVLRNVKLCAKCDVVLTSENTYSHDKYLRSLCKSCHNEQLLDWRRLNRDKVKEQNARSRKKIRKAVLDVYGGKCVKCGFNDYRALQIDHINGNGAKETRHLDQSKYYNKLLSNIDLANYQILCANCNWIKRDEKGETT